ncbi:telomere-protecting terminal protein Tpg [Streptomyces avidinii]|uniref:telomere-protecting terminal protein Tpg n=1 Tax=Streptomyces avidinii TaxID=1895 RepID=UPI003FD6F439
MSAVGGRYRRGDRKTPPQRVADRIDTAVRARWQPVVRGRRRKQAAATTGITVEPRARFGYTAPVGTTDDGRARRLTVHLLRTPAPFRLLSSGRRGPRRRLLPNPTTGHARQRRTRTRAPVRVRLTSASARQRRAPPGRGVQ